MSRIKHLALGVVAVVAASALGCTPARTEPEPKPAEPATVSAPASGEIAQSPAREESGEGSSPPAAPIGLAAPPEPREEAPQTVTSRGGANRDTPVERPPADLTSHRQRLLRRGDQGAAVSALQSELVRKHGYSLAVTGRFDGETEAVVTQFQSHMGLAADGIVGPATWSALINHFVELPWSGPGFYRYVVLDSDSSWGTDQTVAAIKRVAAQWAEGGHEVRIGVNDISLPHAGSFPPHSSHRYGRDVDLRTVRSDGREEGGTWQDSTYSRKLTQELVNLLWATGEVETILFNDPQVMGVKPWPGHDDHLHVRFRR